MQLPSKTVREETGATGALAETQTASAGSPARKRYQAPQILKKELLVASTLVSGGDCVFDPPGSC